MRKSSIWQQGECRKLTVCHAPTFDEKLWHVTNGQVVFQFKDLREVIITLWK